MSRTPASSSPPSPGRALLGPSIGEAAERLERSAGISHDMMNVLTGLSGYLEILDDHEPLSASAGHLVGQARMLAQRLCVLSQDLLDESARARDLAIDLQAVVVDEELASCAAGFPRVRILTDCPPDLVAVADRARLQQVLGNLVSNAEKHGAPPVTITAAAEADVVQIRVRDAGPGVTSSFVPALFDRYARGPSVGRPGTGLGLALARDLAERQGGGLGYDQDDRAFVITLAT